MGILKAVNVMVQGSLPWIAYDSWHTCQQKQRRDRGPPLPTGNGIYSLNR